MTDYSVNEISLKDWVNVRKQKPRTRGQRKSDHIKWILLCSSAGLSVTAFLLMLLGAYLFDIGVIDSAKIIPTCAVPAFLSACCLLFAARMPH